MRKGKGSAVSAYLLLLYGAFTSCAEEGFAIAPLPGSGEREAQIGSFASFNLSFHETLWGFGVWLILIAIPIISLWVIIVGFVIALSPLLFLWGIKRILIPGKFYRG